MISTQSSSSAFLGTLFGLDGKAAAVTGAAEGIGREIAQHLAGAGASVAILDRNSAGAAEAARAIGGNGHRAIAIGMDLSDEISTVDAFREVTHKLQLIRKEIKQKRDKNLEIKERVKQRQREMK